MRMNMPSSPARAAKSVDVVERELFVDRKPETCQFQCDVPVDALAAKSPDQLEILLRDAVGVGLPRDAFAEDRGVDPEPARIELIECHDALLERLAGDEAARSESHPVLTHEAVDALALDGGENPLPE